MRLRHLGQAVAALSLWGAVDAWAGHSPAGGAPGASDAATRSPAEATEDQRSSLPSIEFLLQGWPDALGETPPEDAPNRPDALVETAQTGPAPVQLPGDFELHKLNRSSARDAMPGAAAPGTVARGYDRFDLRVKWYTVAQSLPAEDALRQLTGKRLPLSHNADLRSMWRRQVGPLRLQVAHSATWLRSDAASAGSPSLTLDQTPTGDGRRLMDLAWDFHTGSAAQALHRFDRLAMEYRGGNWTVAAGRQAVSWGGGLVFQPLDLFNPFAPTTVDQDYKAGDDMLRFERLFADGADLQVLLVGRRSAAGDADRDASSLAAKYRGHFGDNEVEFVASQHYGGQVYGVGLRIPAAGALLRSDITWTVAHGATTISGLVNADYTFGLAGTVVHVFGEYFHNGFGVQRLPNDLRQLPTPLLARIGRGELFNLMRNYLAFGTTFRWHFLLNQSLAVIANLHDGSFVAQAALTYDTGNASRLQVGIAKPVGTRGDEFGGVTVGDGLTIGGGDQGFLRFVYFF